jgi:hypothetical protein
LLIPEYLRQKKLYGNILVKQDVHRLYYDAHAASTEHSLDAVLAGENDASL